MAEDRKETQGEVLFPMKNLVTTCGVSRATLLRFEEEGLLTPAKKDPDSGYRYYSCRNLAEIISILQYQHLGFTKKEIAEILRDPKALLSGIAALRKKNLILLRELDDLTADLGQSADTALNIRVIPSFGGTFFTRTKEVEFTSEAMLDFAVETLEAFLQARIPGNTHQTMKVFVDDADGKRAIGQFDGKKHRIRAVIPTMENESGPDIIEIPPCTILTLAVKCDYDQSEVYFREIWNHAKKLGLKPDGPVCIAGLPDSFVKDRKERSNMTLRLMLRTTTPPERFEF